jgi:molybdopterin molybdotransferase
VDPLTFEQARRSVLDQVVATRTTPATEEVALGEADGRVLAEALRADRDFPALARSIRDGFAVRAAGTPGRLRVAGEVRAGETFAGAAAAGEAIEIMTGAPLPSGTDAVVMVEHTQREGVFVVVPKAAAGEYINPQGSEARAGETLIEAGQRIDYAGIALAAAAGSARLRVYAKPRVAILPTGDEVVAIDCTPAPHQVRNSNAAALAVQVRRAGGTPWPLPVAPDSLAATRSAIERALEADLLLLSGGVSAGKYDVVERALAELGAEFFFDRVRVQPGQPLVFGRVRGKFFFGLPGNPASTMVTFEVFARAAVELLAGLAEPVLPLLHARLAEDFRHTPGLMRFLPARLSADGGEVQPVPWRGSSDLAAAARANAFLVVDADREQWCKGELIRVLVR